MKSALKLRLRPLAAAVASCLTFSGCAVWPGSGLPTAASLATGASTLPSTDPCAVSTPIAVRCARYLSNELAKLESETGSWDTAYSLGSVAAGTLAAIYLKSSNDRSQAVEDLAVAVGALAGIRAVLKPDDRRRVARQGRLAVDCMIGAAEGITEAAKEAAANDTKKQNAAAGARLVEQAEIVVQNERALRSAIPPAARVAKKDRSAHQMRIAAADQQLASADVQLRAAEAQAEVTATPLQKFQRALEREYGLTTSSPGARSSQDAPRTMTAAELRLRDAAVARLQQARTADEASNDADAAAKAAEILLPKQLAYSVYEVLNHVRGSIADLSSASENIAKTQRVSVESLITDLKTKADVEEKAAEKFAGGEGVVPVSEQSGQEAAEEISEKPKTAAKRQVAAIYQKCVVSE